MQTHRNSPPVFSAARRCVWRRSETSAVGSGVETTAKPGEFYVGYGVSWIGAAIGLAVEMVEGIIGGFLPVLIHELYCQNRTPR